MENFPSFKENIWYTCLITILLKYFYSKHPIQKILRCSYLSIFKFIIIILYFFSFKHTSFFSVTWYMYAVLIIWKKIWRKFHWIPFRNKRNEHLEINFMCWMFIFLSYRYRYQSIIFVWIFFLFFHNNFQYH